MAIKNLLTAGKLGGIYLETEPLRIYPHKSIGSHVIGFVGIDNKGLSGIEYAFDSVPAPAPESYEIRDTAYGNQIILTIDINIQYMVESLAREAILQYSADSVSILVMSATTGELLAYASIPSFDPNTYYNFSDDE